MTMKIGYAFMFIMIFYLANINIVTVQANETHSKINGVLIQPDKNITQDNDNSSDQNNPMVLENDSTDKQENLPNTGENSSYSVLIGATIIALLFVGMHRKKMFIVCCIIGTLLPSSAIVNASTNSTSNLNAEITSGIFSMSKPNNLNFSAELNNQNHSISLDNIYTTIIDYRGIENGWELSVKSSDFDSYKKSYHIEIKQKLISDEDTVIYRINKQTMKKKLNLSTTVEISADAEAGSYSSNLEWTLQPNIIKKIRE